MYLAVFFSKKPYYCIMGNRTNQFLNEIFLYIAFLFLIVFGHNFHASAQEKCFVNTIKIEGNKRTFSSIILREMSFQPGDSVEVSKIEEQINRSKQNLNNTNLFLTIDIRHRLENHVLDVYILVNERWYLIALPEILLADRSFNEWWYDRGCDLNRLTYGINAKHFNLTGGNDQLKLRAMGGFIPYFELSYSKPYIDKRKRVGIRTGVFYSTQRTIAYRTWNDKLDFFNTENRMRERTGGFFELRLRNALYHFHSFSIGFSSSKISDTLSSLNPQYFGENNHKLSFWNLAYDYRFDFRDNRQYPLKGLLYFSQLSASISNSGYFQTNLFASLSIYKPISGRFFFESNIRGKVSTPKKQLYTTLRGLGFENNLVRGYELYVIDGQNYGIFKNTIRFQLVKTELSLTKFTRMAQFKTLPLAIYPNFYFDIGYIKNYFPEYSNSKLSNQLLKGGGIGLDYVTWYNTTARTYYSINQMGERKLFFGIFREF